MQNGKSLLHFHDVASSTKSTHRSAKKQFGINLNLNDNLMFRGLFLVAALKIKQNQLENK